MCRTTHPTQPAFFSERLIHPPPPTVCSLMASEVGTWHPRSRGTKQQGSRFKPTASGTAVSVWTAGRPPLDSRRTGAKLKGNLEVQGPGTLPCACRSHQEECPPARTPPGRNDPNTEQQGLGRLPSRVTTVTTHASAAPRWTRGSLHSSTLPPPPDTFVLCGDCGRTSARSSRGGGSVSRASLSTGPQRHTGREP